LPGTIGETAAAIEAGGGRALAVQTDMASADDLARLVDVTVETFGRVDLLVNNAADTQGSSAPIEDYPRASWLHQFDVNVHGPFTLMGLVVPWFRRQGEGVIVNITSGSAMLKPVTSSTTNKSIGLGTLLGYATTKAALDRLANAVAADLIVDGIAVVNVDPGFTRTELAELLGERGLVDAKAAAPMDVTVKAVLAIVTSGDPRQYAGQIVRAQEVATA
jgi:NAD(P)-dependent dehydrogenase (short-subunit alcohol dehydrogenase family)